MSGRFAFQRTEIALHNPTAFSININLRRSGGALRTAASRYRVAVESVPENGAFCENIVCVYLDKFECNARVARFSLLRGYEDVDDEPKNEILESELWFACNLEIATSASLYRFISRVRSLLNRRLMASV